MQIYIGVKDKVAQLVDLKQYIVCGNSDYIINFLFDDEWNDHPAKTARFEWGNKSVEIPFTGSQCPCPVITDTIVVRIGVFAGDLDATTPAFVMCRKSILCGSGGHDDPSLDVYNQLMGLLDEMQTGGASPEDIENAVAAYFEKNPVETPAESAVFIVDREKTTHKEVENAVIAGKFCVMFSSGYTYVLADSGNTGVAYDFYAIDRTRYLRWLRLETDNTWTPQQVTLVSEQMMTKFLTQYSDDNQIPTAKAVYTAIDDLKQSGTGGSGLTAEQRNSLLAVINAIGTFNVPNGQELIDNFNAAWQIRVAATNITLDKSALEFISAASQVLTATVEPEDSTDTVVWSTSAPGVATVNNGIVTPVSDGSAVITATAGSVSASCTVSVEFAEEVVYYTITNNLTNCATDNSAVSVVEGGSYSATLTADEGYTLDGASVSVVVNGEDVTDTAYSDGVITIANVTGNVVITVTAVGVDDGESGEVTLLKNISFDGTSYLDTEVIPESVNYRYVMGIQAHNKDIVSNKYIGGISMRDKTNLAESAYWDIYWSATVASNNYNTDVPGFDLTQHCMGVTAKVHAGQDKGDGLSSMPYDYPMYYNYDNGAQSVWLDEGFTEIPVAGHFAEITQAVDFTNQSYFTDDEHPIDSIWLGKVHVTGIMGSLATEANTYAGAKFYCFKVYDTDENLIADMHPAKQGSAVGMWDNVRNKFYPATGTVNYEEVSA